jgi:hypothetical protein
MVAVRSHAVREHDADLFLGDRAGCAVHALRRLVVGARQDPRLVAPDGLAVCDERLDQAPSDSLIVVRRRDANFIDEELWWLVGIYVVNPGRHADNEVVIERDHEVMSRIGEELRAPPRVDRVVEDVAGDVVEDGSFIVAEHTNCDWHRERDRKK